MSPSAFFGVNGDRNTRDIATLANQIKEHADILAQFAARNDIHPSLAANGDILDIPQSEKVAFQARSNLLGTLKELQCLIKGPLGMLMDVGANEILCLQAISRFKIAQAIGKDEEVPFDELSKRCGLNVKDLQRILRYAMTGFIFCEPRPGVVSHSAASQMLGQHSNIQDYVENVCEVRFPASARAVDALEKYGLSQHPSQSGFSMSRNTDLGLYDELAKFPHEARRWNGAMSALAQQIDLDWVLASFLPLTAGLKHVSIVDVGGGCGDISLGLAERLPDASFVIQDVSSTAVLQGQKRSARFGERVRFQQYDFRAQQPVTKADIYYFKNIFHNWPDASCVEILRNHIPALKPGATILIDDFTLHEPNSLSWTEDRKRRWMDVNMLVFFGSRERSLSDWRELLAAADARFRLISVNSAPNQHNSILRVQWMDGDR